jgi:hypothetical protein
MLIKFVLMTTFCASSPMTLPTGSSLTFNMRRVFWYSLTNTLQGSKFDSKILRVKRRERLYCRFNLRVPGIPVGQ